MHNFLLLVGLIVLLLVFPFKLLIDLLVYLYGFNFISPTILAIPLIVFYFFILVIYSYRNGSCVTISLTSLNKIGIILHSIFFISFFSSLILNVIRYHNFSFLLNEIVINHLATSGILFLVYLYAGYFFLYFERQFLYFSFMLILVFSVILLVTELYYNINIWMELNESGAYLRIADVYAVTSLIILARFQVLKFLRIVLIILNVLVLLYFGSRSSFIFYLIALMLYSIGIIVMDLSNLIGLILNRKDRGTLLYCRYKKYLLLYLCILFGCIGVFLTLVNSKLFGFSTNSIISNFSDFRIFQALGSPDADSSRVIFLQNGISRILNNPFTGNIYDRLIHDSSYFDTKGGNYIHNILFLLDDYGVLTFLIFLLLIVWLFYCLKIFKIKEFVLPVLFCLLSLFFTRAYGYPYIFFFLGICLSISNSNNQSTIKLKKLVFERWKSS